MFLMPPFNACSFLAWRISRWVIYISAICHGSRYKIYFEMMSYHKCGNKSGVLKKYLPLFYKFQTFKIFLLKIEKWKEIRYVCRIIEKNHCIFYFSKLIFRFPFNHSSFFKLKELCNIQWFLDSIMLIIFYQFEIL